MHTTTLFPSKYLKAADLDDGPQIFTIRELVMEEIGQGKDRQVKPILYFRDHDKGLVLNVTNTRAIEAAFGTETDAWVGKSIELFGSETPFQGKNVPCVRVRIPRAPSADELTSPGDPDDEIPF